MNSVILAFTILFLGTPKTYLDVTASVDNGCTNATVSFLRQGIKQSVSPKETKTVKLKGLSSAAYPIIICTDTQCFLYGKMFFSLGKNYSIEISQCNLPGVRIESHEYPAVPRRGPPVVRFRSAILKHIEYRYNSTPYRRLGVGLTRYWRLGQIGSVGSAQIQFRYRMVKSGPVEFVSSHKLPRLNSGHKYFVEVKYFGLQKEMLKIQDEGANTPLK